jgi:hypothetical protein
LHGKGLHHAARVAQIIYEDVIHLLLFACVPPKARQHLRDMPAHLFLLAACVFAYKSGSVGAQVFRVDHRNLFDGVSGPSPYDWIIDGEAGKQCTEQLRTGKHLSDNLVGPTDRPAITAFKLAQD